MKNLFRILIIGVLSLCASCEKEPFLDYELPNLGDCLEFTADGGSAEIQITADCSYEVQCKDDWVYAFVTERGGISVYVQANVEIIEREAKINILYYHRKEQICKSIKVKQNAFEPILTIDEDKIEVSAEGGSKYIEVTTNAEFYITKEVDWITCEEQGNGINVTIASSNIINDRSANITISLPKYDIHKVINVHQESAQPSLKIDVEEIVFNADGGTKRIDINANTAFVVSENADWISCTKESDGLKITTLPSTITKERSAKVTISLSQYDVNKEITVIQKAFEPQLVIDGSHTFTFDFRGGEKTVGVISNFNYNVECNSEWLTVISKSNTGIEILLESNNSVNSRSTTIRIYDTQYGIEDIVITIIQEATPSTHVIEYTNDFEGLIYPYNLDAFKGINIISNTYENGKGAMIFDAPITSIGEDAFYNSLITSISIPSSVTYIGQDAFVNCSNLSKVFITDLSAWLMIDFYAIYSNPLVYGAKLYLNGNVVTKVSIPSNIKEIKNRVFYRYQYLTEVVIPGNVTSFGEYSFCDCKNLTTLTIDKGVTSIGYAAFSGCTSLNTVTIPNSVTSIGNYTFSACTSLTSVIIPDSVLSINSGAFYGCTSLISVTIPDKVTWIGFNAFYGCTSLNEVYCMPLTPPSIYYDGRFEHSFPLSIKKIYVSRNSYNSYMQYSYSDSIQSVRNWCYYTTYIEPYDFE